MKSTKAMTQQSSKHLLEDYVNAAYPVIAVSTNEEQRFIESTLAYWPTRPARIISGVGLLRDLRNKKADELKSSYPQAFFSAAEKQDSFLFVLDFQHVVRNAVMYRPLLDAISFLKAQGTMVVLVAPSWQLPAELQHEIPILDFALPTRPQLEAALDIALDGINHDQKEAKQPDIIPTAEQRAACLDAAAGLTLGEAENTFALTLCNYLAADPHRVEQEKLKQIKQSGFLEVYPATAPETVGGLEGLKRYFRDEVIPAKDDPDLRVRGLLLVGVPGGGKSLISKAAGAMLGWPVVRCNISELKGSLVGASEANMRSALKLVESIAPAVFFLDEVEKAVAGHASSGKTDSGVTSGMIGMLLTWLQEHTAPVITIGTCNNYEMLPPELTRAGRFDERFFVDLPTKAERLEIFFVHLRRFGIDTTSLENWQEALNRWTDRFTGAEIEQTVKSAARRTRRAITLESLEQAAREIKPIAKVREAEINALREWALKSLRLANTPEEETDIDTPARRLKRGTGV